MKTTQMYYLTSFVGYNFNFHWARVKVQGELGFLLQAPEENPFAFRSFQRLSTAPVWFLTPLCAVFKDKDLTPF